MPRKKSLTTEIIRTVVGFSDPTLEKAVALLIKRYQKNRALGKTQGIALRGAVNDILHPLIGLRPLREHARVNVSTRVSPSRNPAPVQRDPDLEHIARLKRELDKPPST